MSIPLLLEMAASGYGERVALGPLAGGMTFEDLQIRALGGATVVADRAPSHVVFVGRNGPGYVQAFLSAAVAGVPFVPLNYRLAPAQLHALISELTGSLIIADRAYDSDPLDEELRRDGIEMIAPHRSNRSRPATQDGRRLRRYARRWVVERFFAWVQWQRRILVRWEYYPQNFLGFVQLACLVILFKRF